MKDYSQLISVVVGAAITFVASIITNLLNKRAEAKKERRIILRDKGWELYKNIMIFDHQILSMTVRVLDIFISTDARKEQTGTGDSNVLQYEIEATVHILFPSLVVRLDIATKIWNEIRLTCANLAIRAAQSSLAKDENDQEKQEKVDPGLDKFRDKIPAIMNKSKIAVEELTAGLSEILRKDLF